MIKIKGHENFGTVLNFFSVISWDMRGDYTESFKELINDLNSFLKYHEIPAIKGFQINFASKEYNLNSFFNMNEIVFCDGQNKEGSALILYSNKALNLISKENNKELIKITIFIKKDLSKADIIDITKLIGNSFSVTYGYSFIPKKNQEIVTENILIKKFFGLKTKTHITNLNIGIDVELGYIPKLYKYNLLNKNQIEANNLSNFDLLSDTLYLYEHK